MTNRIQIKNSLGMGFLGISYKNMGSKQEQQGYSGVSHMMEHLMCKTFDDMQEEIKSLGLDDNAFTSDNQIVFWLTGLSESIKEVSERVYTKITKQESLWTKEQFDIEKNVVLQEWADSFNDQISAFYLNLLRNKFNSYSAIGHKQDIINFSYEASLDWARKFITPSDIYEVIDKESYIPEIPFCMPLLNKSNELKYGNYGGTEKVNKQDKTCVGVISNKAFDTKKASKLSFILTCLNSGLESPLYQEIREKRGLSYFSMSDLNVVGDQVIPVFISCTTNENTNLLSKTYEIFFSTPMDTLISKERYEICLKALKIKNKIANILPHSGIKTIHLAEFNPFENLDSFTYEEIITLANETFNSNNLTIETD